jgi:uncharacterized cupin superfamily protein
MQIRRVVTGHARDGRPTVMSDGPPPNGRDLESVPGLSAALVWATDAKPSIAGSAVDRTEVVESWVPAPGETRFTMLTLPPDEVFMGEEMDHAAAAAEQQAVLPGLAETFEPDAPGMHRTDSIDYVIVLDGEVWLDLDGGRETKLSCGDVVIQNGTRHAWRNRSGRPARLAFVLIGAGRDA